MTGTTITGWHEGERAMQARAGYTKGDVMRRYVHPALPDGAAEFLAAQTLAFVTTVDEAGWPRVSTLAGPRGFLRALGARRVEITWDSALDPVLREHLSPGTHVGLLTIDFATRERIRVNGRGVLAADGAVRIDIDEAFGNCPKYIQARERDRTGSPPEAPVAGARSEALAASQRAWVESADTFIIGTRHADVGADTSHRGGEPGFVAVRGPRAITFPDYAGNFMFQTLGNLLVDGRAGLLFPDFESGHALHVTGRAHIDDTPRRLAEFAGAQRVVDVELDSVGEIANAVPGNWTLPERSRFNPR